VVDFSNIKAQDVSPETTREYEFDTLIGEPSVVLAPAHDSNPAFLDERLRLATERAAALADQPRRKANPGGVLDPETIKRNIAEDRDYDRRILASSCIRSWGRSAPIDAQGQEVPFSPENALAFLEALPDYVLDPFRAYASNIFNFVTRPTADPKRDAKAGE
jgi:hypothetical protein